MARRSKKTEEQMKLFDEGGLKDEGGTVDPVSGNDVPAGSTQKEVRDDIPAQLSEGEFVFPADVTRYIGLENLMELRNKAKQGLAQMDAMGQMGNSEEATMDDTAEMDVDIDALIDEFDPNSPETMQFAMGGVVKAQAGALIPSGQMPPQQFSYGYMPPTPPQQAFQYPQYSQMVQQPAQGAVSGAPAVEDKQYIGPNGELITIRFMNGKPQQNIPQGFRVYKPEEEQAEVVAPTVTPENNEDRSDDREREEDQQQQYENYVASMERLASFDPEFKDYWDNSIQGKAAKAKGLEGLKGIMGPGGPIKALAEAFETGTKATDAYERVAKEYGLDLDAYKNTGIKGFFDKFDEDKLIEDVSELEQFRGEVNTKKARDAARERDNFVDVEGVRPGSAEAKKTFEEIARAAGRDDLVDDSLSRGKDITKEVREALAKERGDDSPDDADSRDSGVSGADRNDPSDPDGGFGPSFSKGGAVEQTAAMLTPKKKTRGRRPARKK